MAFGHRIGRVRALKCNHLFAVLKTPLLSNSKVVVVVAKPSNWMLVAPPRVPVASWQGPCYGLVENGDERDTTVELDFGVTLQKAPDYDEGGRNPKISARTFGGVICLNRDGQVRMIF